jgi:hypothetical protein
MKPYFRNADCAAIEAYRRTYVEGAQRERALNIAVSMRSARRCVSRSLNDL